MHAGSRVVTLTQRARLHGTPGTGATDDAVENDEWEFSVRGRFEEHRSMNYGSDVQPVSRGRSGTRTVVSVSFYDKLMCAWQIDVEE